MGVEAAPLGTAALADEAGPRGGGLLDKVCAAYLNRISKNMLYVCPALTLRNAAVCTAGCPQWLSVLRILPRNLAHTQGEAHDANGPGASASNLKLEYTLYWYSHLDCHRTAICAFPPSFSSDDTRAPVPMLAA